MGESGVLLNSIITSMAKYYQCELKEKIERDVKNCEQQSAVQSLDVIFASMDEWFDTEIRENEGKVNED